MQFLEILLVVEHPAATAQVEPGNRLHRPVGDEVAVKLRTHLGDQAGQLGAVILGPHLFDIFIDIHQA